MGCSPSVLPAPAFTPRETGVTGQGAAALSQFALMRLTPLDIDSLYQAFIAMDATGSGAVELPAFLLYFALPPSAFVSRVFALFDANASGGIDFQELVQTIYLYCTLDASALVRLAFMLYDTHVTGYLSAEQLMELVCDMYGSAALTNPRVAAIALEAAGAPSIPYDAFARIAAKFPYLLYPAWEIQARIRRGVRGERYWAEQFAARARRGTPAAFSAWDVIDAMRTARLSADGGEVAAALRERYIPAHLAGSPQALAAAVLSANPRAAAAARRAALGLPLAAGDPESALGDGMEGAKSGVAASARDSSETVEAGGSSVSASSAVGLEGVRILGGARAAPPSHARRGSTSAASAVADAQERAMRMAA